MPTVQVPPGLNLDTLQQLDVQVLTGNDEHVWKPIGRTKLFTNAFVWDPLEKKVLLGMKKRGFGKGLYNGFGGKVDPSDHTPLDAALRELKEEAGIHAPLEHCGTLLFLDEGIDYAIQCELYRAESCSGVPEESEEMRPEWFSLPSTSSVDAAASNTNSAGQEDALRPIPFSEMWPDAQIWLPHLLAKKNLVGRFDFVKDPADTERDVLTRWWLSLTQQ